MAQTALKLSAQTKRRPLCVDLDHTLVRCDIFVEQLVQYLARNPWQLPRVLMWLMQGRAKLKREIASRQKIDAKSLPYNKMVVEYLERQKAAGRKLVLVSGTDQSIAQKVASELGIFNEVYGSDGKNNLTGVNKAKFLTKKFGEKKFAYLGDHKIDYPVWRASAEQGAVVYSNASRKRFIAEFSHAKVFSYKRPSVKVFLKAIRIHQWIKNILVFVPVVFAQRFFDWPTVQAALFGFFAMSFMASSVYVVNDIIDMPSDRVHPQKKLRAFASGKLSVKFALFLAAFLFALSCTVASRLGVEFWGVLAGYVCLTNLYSFWLKQVAIADVIVLASLFSGRLFAGGIVSGIQLSPWLIAFTVFLFLSLALVKRCSELLTLHELKQNKMSGRGYVVGDTQFLINTGLASGFLAVLVLALYINSETAKSLYKNRDYLWLIVPVVLYWITRVWFITNRKGMHHDPVTFVLKDPISLLLGFFAMLTWLIAH